MRVNNSGITVRELRELLKLYNQNAELFMGGLTFHRLKDRGANIVQLEFNETVYKDETGTIIVEQ